MARSNFSPSGLNIGENNANMTYLYGVSDFFSVMFEDTSIVNLLLEGGAEAASEAYSKFLQTTSTISLEDIQRTLGQTLRLIIIKNTDKVDGEVNVYSLSEKILESRYIANRPLLPTALLETDVDYRLEQTASGEFRIRFAADISEAGFSTRLLSDGTTKEYALWFVDSEIDEGWISEHYGNLIGLDPEASTEAFKNFVYGLYYIYINGPTVELIRKGLNLCLGVPLSRETETVLETRRYLETDQYIVVTDQNQYLIPFGLEPIVAPDDVLNVGDELAQWVEVKDYINDGEWWINLMIPQSIIPSLPEGQINRYATAGSHYDYLMRQYLKKHTFLVNVKVQDFKNTQVFTQLSDIIRRAKPSYTQPIYIWTIPRLDETVEIQDSELIGRWDQSRCEHLNMPIDKMHRDNTDFPLKRGCPIFLRYNVPNFVARLCGGDPYTNGGEFPFYDGEAIGFVNPDKQFRNNTETEISWLRAISERGNEMTLKTRNKLGFYRNVHAQSDASRSFAGVPEHNIYKRARVPEGMRILPLYMTTQKDIRDKCEAIGVRTPDLIEWTFDIFNPFSISQEINALPINEGLIESTTPLLVTHFNTLMYRGSTIHYLSNVIPQLGYQTWAPRDSSFVTKDDYILGIRIYGEVIGMYWVTTNTNVDFNSYVTVAESDELNVSFESRPGRSMGPTGSGYYLIRGRGKLSYNIEDAINDGPINAYTGSETDSLENYYSDPVNTPRLRTRDGTTLRHRMELK